MINDDLKPGDRFQDYIIKGCLGQGGMGIVYEAVEEFSGSIVAIKCLRGDFTGREDFVLRFKQESKFYSKLRHPNIVYMNRAGITADGRVFIVMERLIGSTLRSILDRATRLDFLNSLHVLLQIGEAIGAAHEAGIWHRDLKPENVMVGTRGGERGHVWVLDFGIATDGAANTEEMPRLGTFRYLSTEQVRGLKPDGRADIYAFGIIAYEMLTGRHTFLGTRTDATAAEIASGHLNAAAPKPVHELVPDCPEALWPILERCLEKDREQRYGTFADVVDDLRALIRSSVPPEHLLARREQQENLVAARRLAFDTLHEKAADEVETESVCAAEAGNDGSEQLMGFAVPARVEHLAAEPRVDVEVAEESDKAALPSSLAPGDVAEVKPARVTKARKAFSRWVLAGAAIMAAVGSGAGMLIVVNRTARGRAEVVPSAPSAASATVQSGMSAAPAATHVPNVERAVPVREEDAGVWQVPEPQGVRLKIKKDPSPVAEPPSKAVNSVVPPLPTTAASIAPRSAPMVAPSKKLIEGPPVF